MMNEMKKNPNMPVPTIQRWGQYRILGSIEQGRFAGAYLGEHIQHPRSVKFHNRSSTSPMQWK